MVVGVKLPIADLERSSPRYDAPVAQRQAFLAEELKRLGSGHTEKDAMRNVRECVNVVKSLCVVFGYIEKENDVEETIRVWVEMCSQISWNWVKLVKYKLAAFFSARTGQPIPPKPSTEGRWLRDEPRLLAGGRLGRFIDVYLKRSPEHERWELLTSILQSKKGMPRVGKRLLEIAELETAHKLTQEPTETKPIQNLVAWSDFTDVTSNSLETTLTMETIKSQLRRTVKELFGGVRFSSAERVKAFFPSTSANYLRTRSGGGAFGEILEHPSMLDGLRNQGGWIDYDKHTRKRKGDEDDQIEQAPRSA